MAITLPNGFIVTNQQPIDSRLVMSKADMVAALDTRMPQTYMCMCKDDGKLYIYNVDNTVDPSTGKFRILQSGVTYTAGANIQISSDNVISATDTVYDDTQMRADIATKLNKLPNVDDPSDPGYGWPYHIPYDVAISPSTDKMDLTLKTLTLDNNVTKMNFNKSLPGATTTTAGLMTASDKVSLSNKQDALTAGTDIDITDNTIGVQISFLELSGTSGTLTDEQVQILSNSQLSYILLNGDKFELKKTVVGRSGIVATYGSSYESNANVIEVQVGAKTWAYRSMQVQASLTAGDNVAINNNIISAIDTKLATQITLGKAITAQSAIGGISAGKVYSATDTLAQLLEDLLGNAAPAPTGTKLYYSIGANIPSDVSGMTAVSTDAETLKTSGYTWKNITLNNEYPFLAIDKTLGIECYEILQNGFALGFITADLGNQILYYPTDAGTATNVRLVYHFE